MRKIRELLLLKYELGRSHREIALSPGVANSTVDDYVDRAGAVGLSWTLPEGMDDAARRWGRRCSPRLRPRRRAGGLELHVVDVTRSRRPARRALGHGAVAQPDVLPGPVVDLPTSLRALLGSASSAESGDGPPGPSKSVFNKLVPKPADHLATGLASVCRDPWFMKVFARRKHNIITRRLLRLNSG